MIAIIILLYSIIFYCKVYINIAKGTIEFPITGSCDEKTLTIGSKWKKVTCTTKPMNLDLTSQAIMFVLVAAWLPVT